MPRCSASFHATSVCTSTPSTAETTNSARSAACSAATTSPTKSAYPGASSRLTLWPSSSNGRERERHRDPAALLLGVEVATRSSRPRPCPGGGSRRRRRAAPRPARSCRRRRGRRGRRCGSWPSGTSSPTTPGMFGVVRGRASLRRQLRAPTRAARRAGAGVEPAARGGTLGQCSRARAPSRRIDHERSSRMLDRRWRKGVEQGLGPLGDGLRRLGVTADALTVFGLLCSVATALLIASGHLVWAVVGVIVVGRRATCSTARSRGAAVRRARAARSSTRSPTASPTRCCSAASRGTSPAAVAVLRDPRVRGRGVLDDRSPTSGPGPSRSGSTPAAA